MDLSESRSLSVSHRAVDIADARDWLRLGYVYGGEPTFALAISLARGGGDLPQIILRMLEKVLLFNA